MICAYLWLVFHFRVPFNSRTEIWDPLCSAKMGLLRQAARYHREFGVKATLIIDDFDLLAKTAAGRRVLNRLMDFAKQQAE